MAMQCRLCPILTRGLPAASGYLGWELCCACGRGCARESEHSHDCIRDGSAALMLRQNVHSVVQIGTLCLFVEACFPELPTSVLKGGETDEQNGSFSVHATGQTVVYPSVTLSAQKTYRSHGHIIQCSPAASDVSSVTSVLGMSDTTSEDSYW